MSGIGMAGTEITLAIFIAWIWIMFERNGCKYVQRPTYKGEDHLSVSAMECVCVYTHMCKTSWKTCVIKLASKITVENCVLSLESYNLVLSKTNQKKLSIQVEFFLLLQAL